MIRIEILYFSIGEKRMKIELKLYASLRCHIQDNILEWGSSGGR
jgi:hypothetical protein